MFKTERVDRFFYWLILITKDDDLEPMGTLRVVKGEKAEEELKMWENLIQCLNSPKENSQKKNSSPL